MKVPHYIIPKFSEVLKALWTQRELLYKHSIVTSGEALLGFGISVAIGEWLGAEKGLGIYIKRVAGMLQAESVGAIVRSPLNQLLIRKDSGINDLKDLEGKKIGYESFDIDKETVKTMVSTAGGDPSKIDFVDVGYDLMPSNTGSIHNRKRIHRNSELQDLPWILFLTFGEQS